MEGARDGRAVGSFRVDSIIFTTGCRMNFSFWLENKEYKVNLEEEGKNRLRVSLGKKSYDVFVEYLCPDELLLNINGKTYNIVINNNSTSFCTVYLNGRFYDIEKRSASQILTTKREKAKKRDIKTSMPGKIVKVLTKVGDKVKEGQPILVLEAMKMQNEIKSPQAGTIVKIHPKDGDSVETGSLLFSVE